MTTCHNADAYVLYPIFWEIENALVLYVFDKDYIFFIPRTLRKGYRIVTNITSTANMVHSMP